LEKKDRERDEAFAKTARNNEEAEKKPEEKNHIQYSFSLRVFFHLLTKFHELISVYKNFQIFSPRPMRFTFYYIKILLLVNISNLFMDSNPIVNIIAAVIIAVTHAVIVKPINYFYAKKLKVIKYICSFILIAAVLVNIYMILAIAAIDMRDNGKSN
jgi:hypothetical protein